MDRLQKVMAGRGIASRRECEKLILSGRVTVNGKIVRELGTKVGPKDVIEVDGRKISDEKEPLIYVMLNKPRGCVTTVKDPQGRKTVMDLVSNINTRIFPVGRLDYDTEGLLLLTNDGEMAYALHTPATGWTRLIKPGYGELHQETLRKLTGGVELEDGITAPASVKLLRAAGSQKFNLLFTRARDRFGECWKLLDIPLSVSAVPISGPFL